MTPKEKAAKIAEILKIAESMGIEMTEAEALIQFDLLYPAEAKAEGDGQEGIVDGVTTKNNIPFELSGAGKFGVGAKGASVLGEIMSLAKAGERQKETVDAYKDLARLSGEATEVDPSAVNLATLSARGDSEDRASTLAELLDQGVDPAQASKIVQNQQKQDTQQLTAQLGQYGRQKLSADESAKRRRMKFDEIATQAGLPIDYWKGGADIASQAGDLGLGLEALMNPLPTASARSGMKMKYEDGGNLQTTQGASDHSENPMMVTNKDGSPAVDEEGNQIEVTGKETIIPDWLMEQLIAAAKKGPKELNKVFKDEIIDEERFQA